MDSLEAKGMKENDGPLKSSLYSSGGSDLQGYSDALSVSPLSSFKYDDKLTQTLNLFTSSKTEGCSHRVVKQHPS